MTSSSTSSAGSADPDGTAGGAGGGARGSGVGRGRQSGGGRGGTGYGPDWRSPGNEGPDTGKTRRTAVSARLDRLPWSRFHWLVVIALGITWILDGIEVQFASSISPVLQDSAVFGVSARTVTLTATAYLAGEVVGALVFGRLADKLGRQRLFLITLGIYLLFNGLAGFSPDIWVFLGLRFIAGTGIGGEYAAINSAIDELIPARHRGRVDISINGTYWAGAAIAAASSLALLDTKFLPVDIGWRACLFIGPVIGAAIFTLRRHIPESPRWLVSHGRVDEAEAILDRIEDDIRARGGSLDDVGDDRAVEVRAYPSVGYREIARIMFSQYRSRTVLGFTLMVTQSFLYNAIFFTYGLVLTNFFGINKDRTGLFFLPFAIGNLAGPLLLGRLFDSLGRKKMIAGTYLVSAVVLAISGFLFKVGAVNAVTLTILWCVVFFFASAGASSGYLTVSEIFPLELRSQAISFFFGFSQIAGTVAPYIYGALIGDGHDRTPLFYGYLGGAALMAIGGIVEIVLGVDAEGKSLEDVATPLSAVRRDRSQGSPAPAT